MGKVQKAKIRDFVQTKIRLVKSGHLEDTVCGGFSWLVSKDNIHVFTTEEHFATMKFFVDAVEDERLEVVQSDNPIRSARRYKGWAIALEESDEGVSDAYRLSETRKGGQSGSLKGILWVCNMGLRMS